jgi:hypothetical protein
MADAFHNWINDVFGPLLRPFFHAISDPLADVYMPWARICAVGLFIAAAIWVFTLKPAYVNLDAPRKAWYADLRVWTVIAMIPHILVYLFV